MKGGASSRQRADQPTGEPRAAVPPGRRGQTWFTPEYVAWCKRHRLKPEKIAECVLHTWAMGHPGTYTVHIESRRPVVDGEFLDHE